MTMPKMIFFNIFPPSVFVFLIYNERQERNVRI
jgi:hypothetical protein